MEKTLTVYTVLEVAEILSVTRRTIYNYIDSGQLKAIKIGKYWRITEDNLKNFLDKGTDESYKQYIYRQ